MCFGEVFGLEYVTYSEMCFGEVFGLEYVTYSEMCFGEVFGLEYVTYSEMCFGEVFGLEYVTYSEMCFGEVFGLEPASANRDGEVFALNTSVTTTYIPYHYCPSIHYLFLESHMHLQTNMPGLQINTTTL